jgi:hypothetical protein
VGVVGWGGVVSSGRAHRVRRARWTMGTAAADVGQLDERALQRSVGFDAFISHALEELAVAEGRLMR